MNSKTNGACQAFASSNGVPGLSKREYIATQIMAGIAAAGHARYVSDLGIMTKNAVALADTLLSALEETT